MSAKLKYAAQLLLYIPFMVLVGYFANQPAYVHLRDDQALVKLSFVHAAQRKGECRERTEAELAKLSPNMRAKLDCPRERAPISVEFEVDGKLAYQAVLQPSGLQRDGPASVYLRLPVAAGDHQFVARLRDRAGTDFNYTARRSVKLPAGGLLVVDFSAAEGGFVFRHL